MVPPSSHRSLKTSSALQKMAISAEILTKIEETVKLAITNCQAPNLKSIESQLSKLSEAVETYSKKEPLITQPPSSNNIRIATEELIESTPHVSSVTPTCTPYAIYKENFITEEYASEIQDFLGASENFHTEGKRQVVSYGEKYKYMGSNNIQPKQIPDILKPMLESLHKDLGYSLNQILVNKFSKLRLLFKAQKKAIRVVFGNKEQFLDKFRTCAKARPYPDQKLGQEFFNKEHTKPLFISNHILTLQNLNFYHTCSEIFKIFKYRNQISIFEKFKFSARGSKNLFITTPHPSNLYIYHASVAWNFARTLMTVKDTSTSISTFKEKF